MSEEIDEKTIESVSRDAAQAMAALKSAASTIVALRSALDACRSQNSELTGHIGILNAELVSVRDLLESGDKLTAELIGAVDRATQMLSTPATFVFGYGDVGISVGRPEAGRAVLLIEHLDTRGDLAAELKPRTEGEIPGGSVVLLIDNEAGLNALQRAVDLARAAIGGPPAPRDPSAFRPGEAPIPVYEDGV